MIAAGLDGIEKGLELKPEEKGNAYASTGDKVPWRLADAVDLWTGSEWVAETLGEEVHEHYTNMGKIEIEAFGRTVTDWERYRGFERL
jgi:glutamine synthetase